MAASWSYKFTVSGKSHSDIENSVVERWRDYTGNPTAVIPWNTEIKVALGDSGGFVADVAISWDGSTAHAADPSAS